MKKLYYIFLALFFGIFLTACGGGGGGSVNPDPDPTIVNISGKAVDNYIKEATVCIDTNKNNDCSDEISANKTITDATGDFSFSNITLTDDMVIIAYGGKDINTDEDFPYILKNLVLNKDSNEKVILSSLNTLITDYKLEANATLIESKEVITNFLGGGGIDTTNIKEDVIANRATQEDEFLRSLKIFQMIKKLNNDASVSNDYTQSAISFKALIESIINDSTIRHSDATITTNRDGTSLNAALTNSTPVFLNIPTPNVVEGTTSSILDLDFVVDPDGGTITYSIVGGVDVSLFKIESNQLKFKIAPSFTNPSDSDTNNEYIINIRVSDGTNSVTKEITLTVTDGNSQAPTNIILSNSSVAENTAVNTVIGNLDTTDTDSTSFIYTLINGFGDNSDFSITTNQLKVNSSFDYEIESGYNIKINTYDGINNFSKEFNITITDVADVVPVLADTNLSTIESNASNGTIVGTISITNQGDSNIVEYKIIGSSQYFDIDTATGSVEKNNTIPDSNQTYTLGIQARNSAGWSDTSNVYIDVVTLGTDIHEKPTLQNETFSIYEKKISGTSVGTVTVVSNGGDSIDKYRISGTDDNNFSINDSNGTISSSTIFDYETKNSYTVLAEANNTNGWSDPVSITINVLDVNEKPINTSAVNDVNISYGTSPTFNFNIDDGDSIAAQNINSIIVTSSNTSIITAGISPASITNSGIITVTLTGVEIGESNITVTMTDDGGVLNGGENSDSFSFIATVRANGWKIYQNQKASNYTKGSVVFDAITYTWSDANMWYETGTTILIPTKIADIYNRGANFNSGRDEGHYDVNKSSYINAGHEPTRTHNIVETYTTVTGPLKILSNDDFQHDPIHHFFVSRISKHGIAEDAYRTLTYYEDGSDSWFSRDTVFIASTDINTSYGTAENYSTYYTNNTNNTSSSYNSFIDSNNDGNSSYSLCAQTFGEGWRLPTAYEIGINDDLSSDFGAISGKLNGYIPAYAGVSDLHIFTSNRFSDDNNRLLMFSQEDATWRYTYKNSANEIRCIYQP